MSIEREPGFATLAIHAGTRPDSRTGARVTPIYQSTLTAFDTVDQARDIFTLNDLGALHTETANPTVLALEERVATLEGGTAAVATASGHSAILLALGALLDTGDEFIASTRISGSTYNQFEFSFRQFGWNALWVDIDNLAALEAAITPRTKAIFVESISNPTGHRANISALAQIARRAGIPLVVDNTLATPYLIRPLQHGADIVVYAATAFLGGHGQAQGGLVIDGGTSEWVQTGLFSRLTEPRPEYDGLVFLETFGNFAYAMAVRALGLRDYGAVLAPTNAALILSGIETLPLRMQKHCENAEAITQFLQNNPAVEWLSNTAATDTASTAVFTFGLTGGEEAALSFVESVQLITHSAQLGDTRTTVLHPSSTSHAHWPVSHKEALGVGSSAIRLSIGLEDAEDLIADIEQAITESLPETL